MIGPSSRTSKTRRRRSDAREAWRDGERAPGRHPTLRPEPPAGGRTTRDTGRSGDGGRRDPATGRRGGSGDDTAVGGRVVPNRPGPEARRARGTSPQIGKAHRWTPVT